MSTDGITRLLKRYSSAQLFLWIEVTAIHPANQLFHLRFEYLLALLFSIQPDRFEGHNLTRDAFADIVSNLSKLSNEFSGLEDWDPFPQMKLIPFFLNGDKFYFFYGDAERPYEDLRQLVDMYSIRSGDSSQQELALLKKLFLLSLRHQTAILSRLSGIKETAAEHCGIYVPTQDFFNLIAPMFRIDEREIEHLDIVPVIEGGEITGSEKEILASCMARQLFKTFFVHLTIPDEYYFIQSGTNLRYSVRE